MMFRFGTETTASSLDASYMSITGVSYGPIKGFTCEQPTGSVAQLVEQRTENLKVLRSNPFQFMAKLKECRNVNCFLRVV